MNTKFLPLLPIFRQEPPPVPQQIPGIKAQYSEITRTLLAAFLEKNPEDNIVFSPLSVVTLLDMASDATSGVTQQEILEFLSGNNDSLDTRRYLKMLRKEITANSTLSYANAVIMSDELKGKITSGYEERLASKYDGKLFQSGDMINEVNLWIKEKTKGRIQNVVDQHSKDTLLFLLNAVTFDAKWYKRYREDEVYEDDFKNADGTKCSVQMLHSCENHYVEDNYFTGFIRPYRGEEFSFLGLLPKEEGVDALKKAVSVMNISALYKSNTEETVFVSMPEIRCEYGGDLSKICQGLGIKTIFTEKADFAPLSSEWLKLETILHKTYIEIDRKGTRGASLTMGEVAYGALPMFDFNKVKLNRPYVYAVIHHRTGLPVFVGITNQI